MRFFVVVSMIGAPCDLGRGGFGGCVCMGLLALVV